VPSSIKETVEVVAIINGGYDKSSFDRIREKVAKNDTLQKNQAGFLTLTLEKILQAEVEPINKDLKIAIIAILLYVNQINDMLDQLRHLKDVNIPIGVVVGNNRFKVKSNSHRFQQITFLEEKELKGIRTAKDLLEILSG